jgi:digeranylgeranylglycerophospholipid reductase
MMDYDVIIAGGSFAGLAVGAQLKGKRVLLIEPHAIGSVQTSACGTLLATLEGTGTMDSLLQIHDHFVMHVGQRAVEYKLPYPFCTFDYRIFCRRLLDQCDAEVLQASVLGHEGHKVLTTRGDFQAEILIDATGWRAALATNARRQAQPHHGKSFGLETVIPIVDGSLHFYYDTKRLHPYNIGWLFPAGAASRAGFASYRGHTRLDAGLGAFVGNTFRQTTNGRHGGFFPYRRQPATTGEIFRVGDAGGQCLPFTGEGIRPALFFGAKAGYLAQRVLEHELLLHEAIRAYRKFVEGHAGTHRFLLAVQKILPGLPMYWIASLAGLLRPEARINAIFQLYWKAIDLSKIAWPIQGPARTPVEGSESSVPLDMVN